MNYTKQQVDEMLSQVEQEFEKTLGVIAKAEKKDAKAAHSEEEMEAEHDKKKMKKAGMYKKTHMEKTEEAEIEMEASEEEYETIDDLYGSMTKSEKQAHYASVKKALFGEEEETEMSKSEEDEEIEVEMSKAEKELKAKNEELQKSLNTMNELVGKLFKSKSAPKGKAITESYDVIAKSEGEKEKGVDLTELSKSEITARLKKVDYSNLKKSDREAINNFYLDNGSVENIKHLIME